MPITRLNAGKAPETEIQRLKDAIAKSPGNPDQINQLGTLYAQTDRYTEAIECIREAVKLAPRHPGFLMNLSNLINGCDLAGADCPYWFVGDDNIVKRFDTQ